MSCLRLLLASGMIFAPATLSFGVSTASAQQTPGREIAFPTTIQWNRLRGVTKYRLQIASDEQFEDVFFDGPVAGEQYVVSGVASGYYYWRIAPVVSRSLFSLPVRFFVSGGVVTTVRPPTRVNGVAAQR